MQPLEGGRETHPRQTPNKRRNWTLKPALRHQVIMCGICVMFIGMASWFVVFGLQTHDISILLVGLAFASLGGFIIATALTTQLKLTPEHLVARSLWRTQWSLARRRVEIREGTAGPNRPSPGLVIIDIESGKAVRQIPAGQVPTSDMRRLAEIFAPRR